MDYPPAGNGYSGIADARCRISAGPRRSIATERRTPLIRRLTGHGGLLRIAGDERRHRWPFTGTGRRGGW